MYLVFGIAPNECKNKWNHTWDGNCENFYFFIHFSTHILGSDYPSNNCASWKSMFIFVFTWSPLRNVYWISLFASSQSKIEALWVAHYLVGLSFKDMSRTEIIFSSATFLPIKVTKLFNSKVSSYVGWSLISVPIHLVSLIGAQCIENISYEPCCQLLKDSSKSSSADCILL
jgi:hypothetical protein